VEGTCSLRSRCGGGYPTGADATPRDKRTYHLSSPWGRGGVSLLFTFPYIKTPPGNQEGEGMLTGRKRGGGTPSGNARNTMCWGWKGRLYAENVRLVDVGFGAVLKVNKSIPTRFEQS